MADIDVVKKESGSKMWLWILLIVVIALVLWYAMSGSRPQQTGWLPYESGPSGVVAQAALVHGAIAQS